MGTDPRTALARLQQATADGRLTALCERRGVRVLSVFGSVLRPDGRPRDLDVAVGAHPGAAVHPLALVDDLVGLTGCDDVDLLLLDRAGPVARSRALVGSLALYESEPGAYATAQIAAAGELLDTAWLRALDLETMRS